MRAVPSSVDAVQSEFETLSPPAAASDGEAIFRGTHQYEARTVERTYHLDDGLLRVETAYFHGDRELTVVDECWLLGEGTTVRQTGQSLSAFCREYHFEDPVADVACCRAETTELADPLADPDVTSTFQPATTVTVEDGAALRYEGTHRADEARVERAFFVSASAESLRVRTRYHWAGERLGSLEASEALLDGGEFVASTGEPVGAFCRRTHLVDPEADVQYCARLGVGPAERDPAQFSES